MAVDVAPEKLSIVIGKIYDSAVDPALWPGALEATCGLIGATVGVIALYDMRNKIVRMPYYWGGDAEFIRSYESFASFAPFWSAYPHYQVGQYACTRDLMERAGLAEDELLNMPFFKDWALPSGLRDVVAGVVTKTDGHQGVISLNTPVTRDVVGPRDLAVMDLLLPHLRRAIMIGDLLDVRSITAAAFEATLNALSSAVVLVDAGGRILQANQAAQKMFSANGPILSLRGELATHRAEATNALRSAIARAAMNESELGYGGIGVPIRNRNGDSLAHSIAHVLPLKSGTLRPGLSFGAVAAVFVTPAYETAAPPVEALTALYDLTPTEARVMVEIAAGKNRAATAIALGIADSTVKTHLARVFEKTGTSEQPELAKLVTSLTSPAFIKPNG